MKTDGLRTMRRAYISSEELKIKDLRSVERLDISGRLIRVIFSSILSMYAPITQFAQAIGQTYMHISKVSPMRRSHIVHASPNEPMISNTRVIYSIFGFFDQSLTL